MGLGPGDVGRWTGAQRIEGKPSPADGMPEGPVLPMLLQAAMQHSAQRAGVSGQPSGHWPLLFRPKPMPI